MPETLKKLCVTVRFTATTGYHQHVRFDTHPPGIWTPPGTKRPEPKEVLLEAARELARLAALCGWTQELKAKVDEADAAVTRDLLAKASHAK